MVIHFLIILSVVLIVSIIINGCEDYTKTNSLLKLSFTDTMNKVSLPIVSLTNGGKAFNFLIDTGATLSVIDEDVLNQLCYIKTDTEGTAYGIDGNITQVKYVKMSLKHNDVSLVDEFQVLRVNGFDNIKEAYGVQVVGILGSTFLKRYGFTVDFSELTLYTNKKSE